jgi:hypothetical protein
VAELSYGHVKACAHNQKDHNKVTTRNAGSRLESAETLDTPFPSAWYIFFFWTMYEQVMYNPDVLGSYSVCIRFDSKPVICAFKISSSQRLRGSTHVPVQRILIPVEAFPLHMDALR